jgi:hypothetical protein
VRRAHLKSTIGLLGLALVLTSCVIGGDDDDDATGDTPTSTATASTAAPATPTATTAVTGAPAPAGGDLRLVSLNINSGETCPALSDHCQAPDRVAMVVDLVTRAKCPQVVAIQDSAPWLRDLFTAQAATWCNGQYSVVGDIDATDRSMIITSLSVAAQERLTLAGGARTALWARLGDDTGGQVDLVVTRTGAGGDALGVGAVPCGSTPETTCPPPCNATGTLLDCQIVQVGELVQSKRDAASSLVVVAADFGVSHEAPALDRTFWNKGWRDAFIDAGNEECDAKFNIGCTSGRPSSGAALLAALADYNAVETGRTDFVLVSPSLACSPRFDTSADTDADGVGTGLFASRPSDFLTFNRLIWPSDHVGISIDVSCV